VGKGDQVGEGVDEDVHNLLLAVAVVRRGEVGPVGHGPTVGGG
jgi:hypothetical protein